jgi:shikimate dehydrogenase
VDQGKELIRLALFGRPVKSSLSPFIHRMFADQFGLNIEYTAIETGAEGFPEALQTFRLAGGVGCNVTLPLKQEAWQIAVGASAQVKQAHAANTLIYKPTSGWFAYTTDGAGLLADLSGNHGLNLAGQKILILGAGGAAAGVLGSLLACGPAGVVLVNRNQERGRELVQRFNTQASLDVVGWASLSTLGGFDLVINATSLGHEGLAPPLVRSIFAPGAVCYDLNYFKASLPLKEYCEEMNQPYIDGLGMLVEQAAESFFIWTNKKPDSRVVIEACRSKFDG